MLSIQELLWEAVDDKVKEGENKTVDKMAYDSPSMMICCRATAPGPGPHSSYAKNPWNQKYY